MIELARPAMLLGLLAALLPIAIHLLGRRKAPSVQFSALAFLLQHNPHKARRLWLGERALLTLRVAAIALVAIVLAKPLLPSLDEPGSVVAGDKPVALVLVLDDSLSMGVKTSDGMSRFQKARRRAIELLGLLPRGSRAAIVASGYPARSLHPRLRSDLGSVADDLRALQWHPRRDDPRRALSIARQLIVTTTLSDRRIVALSDLQKTAWAPLAPHANDVSPRLVAEAQQGLAQSNVSIIAANAEAANERGPRHVRLNVQVRSTASTPFSGHITVVSGNRELKRWVEVEAGATAQRSFILPADHDTALASIGADDLLADNNRDALLAGASMLHVAIINGAPRPVPHEDEVFFAAHALRLGSERGDIAVDIVQLTDAATTQWQRYDAIIVANVAELPKQVVDRLDQRVRDGAGLLITAGDSMPVNADSWSSKLLPWQLTGRRQLAAQRPRSHALEVADGQSTACANRLREALSASIKTLSQTTTREHALVVPSASSGRATALRFADGAPALLIERHGKGRMALWTTTIDRDWSDIALQPGYMPLLATLVRQLAVASVDTTTRHIEPGEVALAQRNEAATSLEVRAQLDDGPIVLELTAAQQPSGQWHINGLLQPGRYRVLERAGGATLSKRTLIVVPPVSEMAVNELDDSSRWRKPAPPAPSPKQRPRAPGWLLALLFVLMTLMLEGIVLWRMATRKLAKPMLQS